VVDAPAREFFEKVEHVIPHGDGPLAYGPHPEGAGLTPDPHEERGKAGHLQRERPQPSGSFRNLDAGELLDTSGKQVFVEVWFGHADPADQGKALDIAPAFHEFLKSPVEIAYMSPALHYLVATGHQFQRHVAGDSGMLGALPDL
jgi:hypothetical protein